VRQLLFCFRSPNPEKYGEERSAKEELSEQRSVSSLWQDWVVADTLTVYGVTRWLIWMIGCTSVKFRMSPMISDACSPVSAD